MRQWLDKLSDAIPDRLSQKLGDALPDRLSQALPMERRSPRRTGLGTGLGLVGVGLGAGFMYFFDPDTGARRRAQLRARLEGLARRTSEAVDDASRQMKTRAREVMPSRASTSPGEARPS
jgi:hypothetical protein